MCEFILQAHFDEVPVAITSGVPCFFSFLQDIAQKNGKYIHVNNVDTKIMGYKGDEMNSPTLFG